MSETTWEDPVFEQLSSEEALRRLAETPEALLIPFAEFVHISGLGLTGVIRELQSGRLVMEGKPDGNGGYTALCVKIDAIFRWIANPKTPRSRVRKFMHGIKTHHTRPRQRLPEEIRPALL